MRSYTMALCVLLTVPLAAAPVLAEQRVVLIEDFTNIGCANCGAIRDSMDAIYEDYWGQAVPMRYHISKPYSDDAFYLFNPGEIDERVGFYGVWYTPTFRFDGSAESDPWEFGTSEEWYAYVRQTVDSLLNVPSPLRVHLAQAVEYDTVRVAIDVVATEVVAASDLRLLVAVSEWENTYPLPTGSHMFPFREFVTGPDGTPVALGPGDSLSFDVAYALHPDYISQNVITNVILQDIATGSVLASLAGRLPDYSGVDLKGPGESIRVALSNPFLPGAEIAFEVARETDVRLSVYTPEGRHVRDLVKGPVGAGRNSTAWDGRDASGREVGPGVYYYRAVAGGETVSGKIVLLH